MAARITWQEFAELALCLPDQIGLGSLGTLTPVHKAEWLAAVSRGELRFARHAASGLDSAQIERDDALTYLARFAR